eukprot:2223036-Rhodomonas_salina.1
MMHFAVAVTRFCATTPPAAAHWQLLLSRSSSKTSAAHVHRCSVLCSTQWSRKESRGRKRWQQWEAADDDDKIDRWGDVDRRRKKEREDGGGREGRGGGREREKTDVAAGAGGGWDGLRPFFCLLRFVQKMQFVVRCYHVVGACVPRVGDYR